MTLSNLLVPWYHTLRSFNVLCVDGVVQLHIGRGSPIRTHGAATVAESVELLTWLAHESVEQFRDALAEIWPEGDSLRYESAERVALCLSVNELKYLLASAAFSSPSTSHDFSKASRVIQQRYQKRRGINTSGLNEHKVSLRISCSGTSGDCEVQLQLVTDLTRTLASRSASHGTCGRLLSWRCTDVTFGSFEGKCSLACVAKVNALLAHSVNVKQCPLPTIRAATPAAAEEFFHLVKTLLATEGRGPAAMHFAGRLGLMIDVGKLDLSASALLSGVACSGSLTEIQINARMPSVTAVANVMHWVGLAVFSCLAQHNLSRVRVNADAEALRAMFEVLRAADPLAVVFPAHVDSIHRYHQLRVSSSRVALLEPVGGQGCATLRASEYSGLRIIDQRNDWWSVLLPSWGRAWVHTCDAVVTEANAAVGLYNQSIRTLDMSFVHVELEEMAILRSCVSGVETLKLSVRAHTTTLLEWLGLVLSFPMLRELMLQHVRMDQLGGIVDAFDVYVQSASSLRLELDLSNDANACLPVAFTQTLEDPNRSISKCLAKLVIDPPIGRGPAVVRALSAQLAGLLIRNKRLESLQVFPQLSKARQPPGEMDALVELERRVVAFNGAPLPMRVASLGRGEKLALLALASGRTAHALAPLPTGVVVNIFQWAIPRRHRGVFMWIDW